VFCQIPDNLSSSTFPSIAQAARKARIPLFSFASAQGGMGAAVVLARDYRENGRDAGRLAARVLRGESPASMPFKATEKKVLVVNLEAARRVGLNIPPDVMKRADQVIGK
jgi:putative ABC transport system substrate-binding protein